MRVRFVPLIKYTPRVNLARLEQRWTYSCFPPPPRQITMFSKQPMFLHIGRFFGSCEDLSEFDTPSIRNLNTPSGAHTAALIS